eukprot:scaffold107796_cov30-Tisochrysis_lutea.AAC.1
MTSRKWTETRVYWRAGWSSDECISSETFPCRICLARKPKTKSIASITLDLPEPFGPTTEVMLASKGPMVTGPAYDLKLSRTIREIIRRGVRAPNMVPSAAIAEKGGGTEGKRGEREGLSLSTRRRGGALEFSSCRSRYNLSAVGPAESRRQRSRVLALRSTDYGVSAAGCSYSPKQASSPDMKHLFTVFLRMKKQR